MQPLNQALALCIVLSAALLVRATGEDAPTTALTREGAIRRAVVDNPELAVAVMEIARAKSRLRWAGRLENPELELSSSTDQLGLNEDEGTFEIAFSQRFPITSRLKDEKVVRKHDVELAEIEFQVRQRQLAYEVDKAWIELKTVQRSEVRQKDLLKLNREISTFLEGRAKVGEASPLDATQAALNGKLLEQELGVTRARVVEAMSTLGQLIGLQPGAVIMPEGDVSPPKSAPPVQWDLQTALANRPDYSALLTSGDLGRAQLALAMSQRWDDIALKVFAERERANDEPGGLERNSLVGIGISIPLPLRNRNEQAIEEAKIDIEKVRRARGAKAFEIHSELKKALQARLSAYELLQSALNNALPLAKKNFDAFRSAQQDGLASPLQVQQAQEQLLQLETSALALRKNYEMLDAEVRFIGGTYPIPKPVTTTK